MANSVIPQEIIEVTIGYLPPKERFLAATVGSIYIRDKTIPLLPECSIDNASEHGKIDLLQWWLNSGKKLVYSHRAMDRASKKGQVAVLQWWKQSGLPLKFTKSAMISASEHGHVHVLDWWRDCGLTMIWSCWAIEYATENDHVSVLDWWKRSGLPMLFFDDREKIRSKGYTQGTIPATDNKHARTWWEENADIHPWSTDMNLVLEIARRGNSASESGPPLQIWD